MTHKTHKIHGQPFDIVEIHITPHEVEDVFILDADFQRSVRKNSPMICGIQRCLRDKHGLRSTLHLYTPKGEKRFVVVDGMHRIYALANLDTNLRCTIYGVVHSVHGKDDAVRLFEELNKTIPPSISHFLKLQADRKHPGLTLLEKGLPFAVAFNRGTIKGGHGDPAARGAPTLNQIIYWMTQTFGDLSRVSRFTLEEILDVITEQHVDLLADFALVFAEATGPINRSNVKYDNGWFDVLFKIYAQNCDLQLCGDEWVDRFRRMFKDHKVTKFWETPRKALVIEHELARMLESLSKYHAPRVIFDPKNLPTINDISKAAAGAPRVPRGAGRRRSRKAG